MERLGLSAGGGLRGLVTVPAGAKKLTQRVATCAISAKKLAQHAIKRPFWAILPALGEYFCAIAIDSRRWANFVAPMLLTAPQDETVDTNAETSGRLHETHDAFAHQNCAENRCIWLAMVSSVSPETEHTPAKVLTVSRESPAAPVSDSSAAGLRDDGPSNTSAHQSPQVWRAPEGPEGQPAAPVGGGGAWPGFEPTRRATHQRPGAAGVEGAGGSGGHGRASRSTTPSLQARVWRSRGRPGPTAPGTPAATKHHSNRHRNTTPGIEKTDIRIGCRPVVELGGFEPPTFSLRTRRATNCAIAPRTHTA